MVGLSRIDMSRYRDDSTGAVHILADEKSNYSGICIVCVAAASMDYRLEHIIFQRRSFEHARISQSI